MNTTLTIQELNYKHECSGQNFFSFKVTGERDGKIVFHVFSNWMCMVDEVLHDAMYGVDDDTYDDMVIPVSPMVNIPAIVDTVDKKYNEEYRVLVNKALSKKLGINADFPLLCEASEFDEIVRRKEALGYKFVPEYADFEHHPA